MSLDTVLWLSGCLAEAAVIGLLLKSRVWRAFPLFFSYSVWSLVESAGGFAILHFYSPSSRIYVTSYFIELIADSVLMFGVLFELGWSALRPLRASLSYRAFILVGLIILAVGAATWPFTAVPGEAYLFRELIALMRLQQTFSAVSVVMFLLLAAGSQLLSISWRDRELQIATGLGFYSLAGLVASMLHTHQAMMKLYNRLDEFVVACYLASLVYWIVSFAQQEEQRREFTPQMQSMLLAVAGAARATRASLADSNASQQRNIE